MKQDFKVYAGDTKKINVTVTNADNSAVDLMGAAITWALKQSVKSTQNLVSKSTVDGGISINDASNGKFQFLLNPTDTKDLIPEFCYHEAELTDAQGNVSTIFTGSVQIIESGV